MKRIELTMEIERGDIGTVEIEAEYVPATVGSFYNRNGDPGDPPEAAEIHRLRAFKDATAVVLTDAEYERACELIHERADG